MLPFDIDAVMSELNLEQKASLLSGFDDWRTHPQRSADGHWNVPPIELGDGPHGLRKETGVDMVWVPATCFPTASALGATWDRELVARVAAAIGTEAAAEDVQVVLGPGVNMKRSPLCGRNFEYFSEDPVLSGELGSAYVKGLQRTGVASALKHFAANNQEIDRTRISVEADDRTLREIYLAAFERVVTRAKPWLVMCSYNRLRGVHASQNRWLLTAILRDEWGFDGVVVSDWDAVHDRVAALRAGLDLEMPGTGGRSTDAIVNAVHSNELSDEVVDCAARRVLELVARAAPQDLGTRKSSFVEHHVPGTSLTVDEESVIDAAEHHHLAREAAAGCITLLRNEEIAPATRCLPLSDHRCGRIAVIGEYARDPRIQGGGSSGVAPVRVDSPLRMITEFSDGPVAFAPGYVSTPLNAYQDDNERLLREHGFGCGTDDRIVSSRSEYLTDELQIAETVQHRLDGPLSERARELIEEATAVAREAETIIVFCGLPLSYEQEANDRQSMELPGDQRALLEELCEVKVANGASLVVVISSGSAVTMGAWHERADAILETWLFGQAGAGALVDILFGRVNPSGRLSETFPLRLEDTPGQPNWQGERGVVTYGEGVFVGYRWYDALDRAVLYPFGHGLSYSEFEYRDLEVRIRDEDEARVQVTVTIQNAGSRDGAEVVQLYVGDPASAVHRPKRELKGFEKVVIPAGASRVVTFDLESRDFAYWDSVLDRHSGRTGWRREGGVFVIEVGASSRDIRLAETIMLKDDPLLPPVVPDHALEARELSKFAAGYSM